MVRRWSYINNLNIVERTQYPIARVVRQDRTARANLYFKAPFSYYTKLRRPAWIRRRHRSIFIIYFNVMSDWASDYRFFRSYNKYNLVVGLFSTSYFSYNLFRVRLLKDIPCPLVESTIHSSATRKLFHYFIKQNIRSTNPLLQFNSVLWLYTTAPRLENFHSTFSAGNLTPLYTRVSHSLIPFNQTNTKITYSDSLASTFLVISSVVYDYLTLLYGLIIQLIFYLANNSY